MLCTFSEEESISDDDFLEIWESLELPESALSSWYVIQSYPRPRDIFSVQIIGSYPSFNDARRAADIENMGRDYSTVSVFQLYRGRYFDQYRRPLQFAEPEPEFDEDEYLIGDDFDEV